MKFSILLAFAATSGSSHACPKLEGNWNGICQGPGPEVSRLSLIISQTGCDRVKIKSFQNTSTVSIEDINIGVTGSGYFFDPAADWSSSYGTIGFWRSERTLESVQHQSSADVAETPAHIRYDYRNKQYSLQDDVSLNITEQRWSFEITNPIASVWEPKKSYSLKSCPLTKSL